MSIRARTERILTFALGASRLGLLAGSVLEVARVVRPTALPSAPPIVEGVIDHRGRPVAVLDVRARFGMPRRGLKVSDHLVIAGAGSRVVAIRVDRALDIVDLPVTFDSLGVSLVAGVARLPDGLVVIHDLGAFLADDEAIVLDAAMSGLDGGEPAR